MKRGAIVAFFLVLLFSGGLVACKSKSNDTFTTLIKVPNVTDLNQSLELRLNPYKQSNLTIGSLLQLEILNKSDKFVRFPVDNNAQIFLLEGGNGDWKEVENKVGYQGEEEVTAPQGEKGLHDTFLVVKPVLDKDGQEKHIRIVVTGIVVEKGVDTDKAVSAYLDLTLKP